MKGVKSHQIIRDGLAMLENLTHRGAVGSDPLMGDGAGLLAQIPDRLLPRGAGEGRHHAAAARTLRRRLSVHAAATPALRAHIEGIIREAALAEGRDAARLPRRAGRQFVAVDGAAHRRVGAGPPAGVHRPQPRHRHGRRVRAPALYPAQGDLGAHPYRDQRRRQRLLHRVDVGAHDRLQGHVPRLPGRPLLQGSCRPALRERAGADPPALLDQHLPVVEAGASLSHGRPQWRDQHAARQRQLDGGAAGVGRVGAVRQGHLEAVADLL